MTNQTNTQYDFINATKAPEDGQYIVLKIMLKKNVNKYTPKSGKNIGKEIEFVTYAEKGSNFAYDQLGKFLDIKLTIKPQAPKVLSTSSIVEQVKV